MGTSTQLTLKSPVAGLTGVGPRKAKALKRLGIETVKDLQSHYPTRVEFAPEPVPLATIGYGDQVTVVGTLSYVQGQYSGKFDGILNSDLGGIISITWYNAAYLHAKLHKNIRIMATGTVAPGGLVNPEFRTLPMKGEPNLSDLRMVTYPVTSGITSREISRFVKLTLHLADDTVRALHNPADQAEYDRAVQHEKYCELFYMQLALAVRKQRRELEPTNVKCVPMMQDPERYFPFDFTPDQLGATRQVLIDMCQRGSMNRLLQGDVGSGKTAVAAYAAMLMACNSGQTAILCPTQVLAEQHYRSIKGFFDAAGMRCRLVQGGLTKVSVGPDKRVAGDPDVVIGTTAILSDGLQLCNLGLAIIDEQHKFGVEQRAALRKHGNPHVLLMSATPIPRTIAMTAFGDLDVSVIKTMPPGRLPVYTEWVSDVVDIHARVEYELEHDNQVYVVCPRIEALDDEMRAVEEVVEEYRSRYPSAGVGMLHGQMHPADKKRVADDFKAETFQILVATTVIEVGVDNPNATVMVVEGAERFGLATLHQLRGRVGRSDKQSYCFLLSDTENGEGRARLKAMEQTNDGFLLAEQDLKMRGPGSLISTEQHGLPNFRIANMVEDFDLMIEARSAAATVLCLDADDPVRVANLSELKSRYGGVLHLGDVG